MRGQIATARACSSVGRAPRSHRGGQRFKSAQVHPRSQRNDREVQAVDGAGLPNRGGSPALRLTLETSSTVEVRFGRRAPAEVRFAPARRFDTRAPLSTVSLSSDWGHPHRVGRGACSSMREDSGGSASLISSCQGWVRFPLPLLRSAHAGRGRRGAAIGPHSFRNPLMAGEQPLKLTIVVRVHVPDLLERESVSLRRKSLCSP